MEGVQAWSMMSSTVLSFTPTPTVLSHMGAYRQDGAKASKGLFWGGGRGWLTGKFGWLAGGGLAQHCEEEEGGEVDGDGGADGAIDAMLQQLEHNKGKLVEEMKAWNGAAGEFARFVLRPGEGGVEGEEDGAANTADEDDEDDDDSDYDDELVSDGGR